MRTGRKGGRFPQGPLPGLFLFVLLTLAASAGRAEDLPPRPATYFFDQAGVVDAGTAQALNERLEQFERDTSNQILVAIYPGLPDQASVDQYAIDTYNAWQVGQKGKDNGAILFVFVRDRKTFIVTGRGLEGTLPDATCKEIVRDVITPPFRQGDYAGGIQAGVAAMLAATKGEYRGTGRTANDRQADDSNGGGIPWIFIVFIVLLIASRFFGSGWAAGPMIYTGGGWGGGGFGGGGFGGGGFGGGGGGFSGGGGSSAGGGAGGSW